MSFHMSFPSDEVLPGRYVPAKLSRTEHVSLLVSTPLKDPSSVSNCPFQCM